MSKVSHFYLLSRSHKLLAPVLKGWHTLFLGGYDFYFITEKYEELPLKKVHLVLFPSKIQFFWACVYVCVWVFIFKWVYMWTCSCIVHYCIYTYTCTQMNMYMYSHICVLYIFVNVCACSCMCVHIHVLLNVQYVEARDGLQLSATIALQVISGDRASHWTREPTVLARPDGQQIPWIWL